jgi:hypothetical protein
MGAGSDALQLPWEKVKEEMVVEKGLDEAVADKIGEYVKHKGMLLSSIFRRSTVNCGSRQP